MSEHTCMQHFWSSFSSFGTIFAQTFCMPKSLVIIFQMLSFFISSWLVIVQPAIATQHLPYPVDIDLSPTYWRLISTVCWRLPTSGIIFTLLTPLFKCLVQFKIMCTQCGVIFICLLKHFKCLWLCFPQHKFQVYLWLGGHCSFFSA